MAEPLSERIADAVQTYWDTAADKGPEAWSEPGEAAFIATALDLDPSSTDPVISLTSELAALRTEVEALRPLAGAAERTRAWLREMDERGYTSVDLAGVCDRLDGAARQSALVKLRAGRAAPEVSK